MFIDDRVRYIKVFLFLYSNPWANLKEIGEHLDKKYDATLKLLRKLSEKKYVERRRKTGRFGGAELEFKLSDKTIKFLKDLMILLKDKIQLDDNS